MADEFSGAITTWDASTIARAVGEGVCTAEAVTAAHLQRIAAIDPQVQAFIHVDTSRALAAAQAIDARRARGEKLGPLAGVPVAVKDQIAVAGLPQTAASKILQGYIAPYDATAVALLRAADAVVIGKTNQDEFGMGSSTENSAWGPTHNPWDLQRIPGGSSGGSAAAVAAALAPIALGTDTGGSIRQPAALCGVSGLKPTYGRVSRYGAIAFASSLDQIGPMARSPAELALVLQVLAGLDPRDATSEQGPALASGPLIAADLQGVRLGVPVQWRGVREGQDPGVAAQVQATLVQLATAGAKIVEVDVPLLDASVACYYVVATAEASANLARYDGIRFGRRAAWTAQATVDELYASSRAQGFGAEVQRRILLGTYALSSGYYDAFYKKASQVRRLLTAQLHAALAQCDALVGPTSPQCAWPLGARTQEPMAMYLMDIFTISANLAGLPALSLPVLPHPTSGLPIGLQLLGAPWAEWRILSIAKAISDLQPGPQRWPTAVEAP